MREAVVGKALIHSLRIAAAVAILFVTSAAEGETVVVRGDRSVAIDQAKLGALVHLELGERADQVEAVIVEISGTGANVATILVTRSDGRTNKGAIDLRASDPERTIALFVGELSRDESPNVESDGGNAASPTQTRAPPPVSLDTRPTEKPGATNAARLFAGAGVRVVGMGRDGAAVVSTPAVGASLGLGAHVRVGVLARAGFASKSDRLGKVSALLVGGGIDAAYRAHESRDHSLKIDTGPRLLASWIQGEGLARTEGGAAQINRGRESSAWGLDLAWFVEATMTVAGPVFLGLGLEGGWLTPGLDLRADERSVLQVSGATLGATLSVGLDFEAR